VSGQDQYGNDINSPAAAAESYSFVHSRLMDANGDGRLDVLYASKTSWDDYRMEDPGAPSGDLRQFTQLSSGMLDTATDRLMDSVSRNAPYGQAGRPLELRHTRQVTPNITATGAYWLVLDVNGDGRLDLIEAHAPYGNIDGTFEREVVFEDDVGAVRAAEIDADYADGHEWRVSYGTSSSAAWGDFATSSVVAAPLPFPSISVSHIGNSNPAVASMVDINGDGWLDIVWHDLNQFWETGTLGSEVEVYLKIPGTSNGWETVPIVLGASSVALASELDSPFVDTVLKCLVPPRSTGGVS
jgi:hypothetical protein